MYVDYGRPIAYFTHISRVMSRVMSIIFAWIISNFGAVVDILCGYLISQAFVMLVRGRWTLRESVLALG